MPRWLLVPLVAALALAGCLQPPEDADDDRQDDAPADPPATSDGICVERTTEPTGPSAGQTGVTNQPGSFTYGGQVAAKTAKETFVWENPSRAAQVVWGGQAGTGMLKITLQDHCDEVEYEKELSGAGQQSGAVEMSTEGEPGQWFITLEFTLYTGQMGLTISSA